MVGGNQGQKAGLVSLAAIIGLSAIALPAQSAPPASGTPAPKNSQAQTKMSNAQRLALYKKEVARRGGGKSYFRDFSKEDILLVMPTPGAKKDDLKEAFEDVHGTVLGVMGTGPMKVLIVKAEKGKSHEMERKLSKDKKNFKAISFNKRATADYVPSEPRMSESWHLPVMNCYEAWNVGRGTIAQNGQRSRIAVLDTGCSWQGDTGVTPSWGADVSGIHKDIGEKVDDALDGFLGTGLFSDDVEDIEKDMEKWANKAQTLSMGINDNNGHGTWVASTAAGRENGKNSLGIAPGADIYPIKIADAAYGARASADEMALVAGMVIAINSGARIVNISYSDMNNADDYEVLHEMFKYFYYHKNGLIFVSAGNDGQVKDFDDCVYLNTVSALQEVKVIPGKPAPLRLVDMLATNGGWAASSGRCVDFAAPGLDIPVSNPDGTAASVSGSSFSSPIVAGVAALILSINPKLTNKQVETILVNSCHGVNGRNTKFGYGMPDAEKAVKMAQSM